MKNQSFAAALLFLILTAFSAGAAEKARLVVDRGVPQVNLNNTSGESRANVRWSDDGQGFIGDDFSIGAEGETWVIDSIRTWAVPQIPVTSTRHLGDLYQDVRLYLGTSGHALTPVASAMLSEGSDQADVEAVRISDATQSGTLPYDDFGKDLRIFQIDFTQLNRVVEGGVKYAFGVFGMGRPIPEKEGKVYPWFNLASNAQLSAAQQDGADGMLLLFDGRGKFEGTFDSNGKQWNKSSDINVQVFAHRAVK